MSTEHPPKEVEMGKTGDLGYKELEGYKLTAELEYALRKGEAQPNLEDDTRTIENIDKIENELEEITNKEKEQRDKQREEEKQKEKTMEGKKSWADRKGWRGPVGRIGKLFGKMVLGIFSFATSLFVFARYAGIFKKEKEGSSGGGSKPKKDEHH